MSTGYCGTDGCDIALGDNLDPFSMDRIAYEMAVDHAEAYGIYPYPEEYDEDEEEYSDNIEGSATLYNPSKHDMKRCGGGSFLEEYTGAKLDKEAGAYYVCMR